MKIDLDVIKALTKLDKKNLIERSLKLSEECGEVAEAVLAMSNCGGSEYKVKDKNDVIEECLDTMMIALSLITTVEPKINETVLECMFDTKMQKWEEKMA